MRVDKHKIKTSEKLSKRMTFVQERYISILIEQVNVGVVSMTGPNLKIPVLLYRIFNVGGII